MKNHPLLQLGIRANFSQFSLLILVNAFVGAMVGMERSILPLIARQDFGIVSHSAIFSFIASFGVVKAFSNLFAGRYADIVGRKKLLVAGWLVGLLVPFLLIFAQSWMYVVIANILLGVNQGLCWSMTVVMKSDLTGQKRRGLAMGLNEFAGYLAVAISAYITAMLASQYGLRPVPFYLGVGISVTGLFLSLVLVKETLGHVEIETKGYSHPQEKKSFREIFRLTTWTNPNLFSCSQAGFANNMNDGMAWGLFPLFFASLGYALEKIGFLVALYPATWGVAQLFTGAISDKVGRRWMIAAGMWLQAISLWMIAGSSSFHMQVLVAILLGVGTAMVYPTLIAAVGDIAHPEWRASAIGVYRLWRDMGYAVGAALAGVLADRVGLRVTISSIGILTFFSGVVVLRFQDLKKKN